MFEEASVARFTNWSDEMFTCKWAGEEATFEPGESKVMVKYLAEHFAKHLTDRELVKMGSDYERMMSPKKKEDNKKYMEIYSKAYTDDVDGHKNPSSLKEFIDENEKLYKQDLKLEKKREKSKKKVEDEFEGK